MGQKGGLTNRILHRLLLLLAERSYRKREQADPEAHPKNANFNDFSDRRIHNIQKKLNMRPREKINFDTPKRRFFANFD